MDETEDAGLGASHDSDDADSVYNSSTQCDVPDFSSTEFTTGASRSSSRASSVSAVTAGDGSQADVTDSSSAEFNAGAASEPEVAEANTSF